MSIRSDDHSRVAGYAKGEVPSGNLELTDCSSFAPTFLWILARTRAVGRLMNSVYRVQHREGVTGSVQIMRAITADTDEADAVHPQLVNDIKLLPKRAASRDYIHVIDRNGNAGSRTDQQRTMSSSHWIGNSSAAIPTTWRPTPLSSE